MRCNRAGTREEFLNALAGSRKQTRTTVIVIEVDGDQRVPGYESWWDVPVAEESEMDTVRQARRTYEGEVRRKRQYL